ncbi:hypothetical protein pdam_00003810 [Pocillopora damicornis]|uniref:Uncharacterized protein n=1 Tax=Pocillopora damicornis TaxID=46731 RepID=A0A3M6T4R7_POCDA|nr:hypothetical protein pdam_00003810 [Pocillopora damicornis]
MATAESPPCPKPLATLDLCNTEPDNEDGGAPNEESPPSSLQYTNHIYSTYLSKCPQSDEHRVISVKGRGKIMIDLSHTSPFPPLFVAQAGQLEM